MQADAAMRMNPSEMLPVAVATIGCSAFIGFNGQYGVGKPVARRCW